MDIGVLGLQGSVKEHCDSIKSQGDIAVVVRYPEDLDSIDALIIPGGESTTLVRLLKIKDMDSAIILKALSGMPIWGTCAGLILLSSRVEDSSLKPLGLIDITARRNGYGTQHDSFTTVIQIQGCSARVRFIRAPRIVYIGDNVKVVTKYEGEVVAATNGKILVTTFHPEVTEDKSFYRYFKTFIEN